MTQLHQLEGTVLDGRVTLIQYDFSGASPIFFGTLLEEAGGDPVIVRFFPESPFSGSISDRHREAIYLSHPNLLKCLGVGQAIIAEESFVYAIYEQPDLFLADFLKQRPLTTIEAKQLTTEVIAGLRYLHGLGLICCNLDRSTVARKGNAWRLADYSQMRLAGSGYENETRRLMTTLPSAPPEAFDGIVSPAWDAWSLVSIIGAVFAGPRAPLSKEATSLPHDAGSQDLPEPFRSIEFDCSHPKPELRCSLEEIEGRLRDSKPLPVATVQQAVDEPARVEHYRTGEQPPPAVFTRPPISRQAMVIVAAAIVSFFVSGAYFKNRKPVTPPPAGVLSEPRPTPTDLTPTVPSPTAAPTAERSRESDRQIPVEDVLERWVQTFRAGDLSGQMALYAPRLERFYLQSNVPISYVRGVKMDTIGRVGAIRRYQLSDVKTTFESPTRARVDFDKEWDFTKSAGKVRGQLKLRKLNGAWRIVSERDVAVYRQTRS